MLIDPILKYKEHLLVYGYHGYTGQTNYTTQT